MLIGRIVAALCHGAFFGVGAVLAAKLVEPHRKAASVSIMFAGLKTANVLGVPFGTFLGQNFGWRSTFWAITGIGIIALIGILAFIKTQPANQPANLRLELKAFTNVQVWLSILVTVFGFGAMFGAFTYIAPILTQVAGFPETAVPWMLVLFGAGLFAGNICGGRAADRNLDKSLLMLLSVLAVHPVQLHCCLKHPVDCRRCPVPAWSLRVRSRARHADPRFALRAGSTHPSLRSEYLSVQRRKRPRRTSRRNRHHRRTGLRLPDLGRRLPGHHSNHPHSSLRAAPEAA